MEKVGVTVPSSKISLPNCIFTYCGGFPVATISGVAHSHIVRGFSASQVPTSPSPRQQIFLTTLREPRSGDTVLERILKVCTLLALAQPRLAWEYLPVYPPSATAHPAEPYTIQFIPPESIRLGERQARVGSVVYRLLRSLFDTPAHALTVSDLEKAVWGNPVNRNTLWSACRRARGVLIKLNHPLRVALDGDRVTLL